MAELATVAFGKTVHLLHSPPTLIEIVQKDREERVAD